MASAISSPTPKSVESDVVNTIAWLREILSPKDENPPPISPATKSTARQLLMKLESGLPNVQSNDAVRVAAEIKY